MMKEETIEEKVEMLAQAHNHLTGFVMNLGNHMEQMSNLFHLSLLKSGLAKTANCSNCNAQVIYPDMPEFLAFPVCVNAEKDEACKEGFSHIENPFDEANDDGTKEGDNTDKSSTSEEE